MPDAIPLERLVESVENAPAGGDFGDLDDLAGGEYAWEGGYEQSWNRVQLDQGGQLLVYKDDGEDLKWIKERMHEKKKRIRDGMLVRRAMVRNLFIVIDFTHDSTLTDYKPNRTAAFVRVLLKILPEVYSSAPLLTVGLIAVSDRVAQVIAHPTSDIDVLRSRLDQICNPKVAKIVPEGNMSVYNGVERAMSLLESHPEYAAREIIVCMSSIQTVDPSSLEEIIPRLQASSIRVSVVTVCAEMYAVKRLCDETKGLHRVVMDLNHLTQCMNAVLETPSWNVKNGAQLLPVAIVLKSFLPSVQLCLCHQNAILECITCPKCGAIYCSAPMRCLICDIILVGPNDLYRIALPYEMISDFKPETIEVPRDDKPESLECCDGCDQPLYVVSRKSQEETGENLKYRCESCSYKYCSDCHDFQVDTLRHCYGCQLQSHMGLRGVTG